MSENPNSMSPSYKELLETLNPQQIEFINSKTISGNYVPDKWFKLLHRVARLDKIGDDISIKFRKRKYHSFWALLIAFILVVVGAATEMPIFDTIAGLVVLGGIIMFIVLWRMQVSKKPNDLQNNFRMTAMPILQMLMDDVHPRQKMQLNILAEDPTSEKYLTKTVPKPGWTSPMPRIGIKYYTYPWMEGQATLKDGSLLRWQIESNLRHKNITKRGSSGKTKIKNKYKIKHKIQLEMQLPKSVYPYAQSNIPETKLEDAGDYWKVKLKKNAGTKSARDFELRKMLEREWFDPFQFAHVVRAAYSVCNKASV